MCVKAAIFVNSAVYSAHSLNDVYRNALRSANAFFSLLSVWVRKESVRQDFAFGSFPASSLLRFQTSVGAAEAFPPFALTLSSKIF